MIQELFGGAANSPLIIAAAAGPEGNFNNGGIILHGTPAATAGAASSPSPAASPSSSSTSSVAVTAATAETQQNLRCPRCDSSNTKFCYYNNYNLTQPRHFCKTCRRYWTKGGALRNVPIGGGCRKNKTSTHISSTVTKSTVAKFKAADMGIRAASHLIGGGGFDPHDLTSGPVPWAPPQSAQILALLRGNPINPNPNPNPNIKEEGNIFGTSHGIGNGLGLGLDPLIGHQLPNSMGLCGSFWRNNGNLNHHQMAAAIQQNHGYHHHHQASELQNQSAMQALYQRIKLSTGESNNTADHHSTHQSCSNTIMASSSSSIMEQPLMAATTSTTSADQMVYWQNNNAPAFCWSDLPTTTSNGAYP